MDKDQVIRNRKLLFEKEGDKTTSQIIDSIRDDITRLRSRIDLFDSAYSNQLGSVSGLMTCALVSLYHYRTEFLNLEKKWPNEYRKEGSNASVPANNKFPNLARGENPDKREIIRVTLTCEEELEEAGIPFHSIELKHSEVPTTVVGKLGGWTFNRLWYYWSACSESSLPIENAEQLHALYGTEIRVQGHCGCPNPREYCGEDGVNLYHVDSPRGLKALADQIKNIKDL